MLSKEHQSAHVLVVDDVSTNVRLLSGFLRPMQVRTAQNGHDALAALRDSLPDLILLDAVMPGMDGFELLRILKADPRMQHIPVIMVTALSALEDKIRGQEAGADDFISKPFDRTELLLRVKAMLRIKFLHDQLSEKVRELEDARRRLNELAQTDDLTGLFNKRHLSQALQHEWERASRYDRRFALIMIDIDHFKSFNDTHGHPTGDHVLRQAAALLAEQTRRVDTLARYGGEEFVHLLLETGIDGGTTVAERHRQRIAEHAWVDESGASIGALSISAGVAAFPDDGATLEQVLKRADERLYLAKRAGRNRVVATDEPARDGVLHSAG